MNWRQQAIFAFFLKINVQPFLYPPPTSSLSQCSWTFSQIRQSWSPTKQFIFPARNNGGSYKQILLPDDCCSWFEIEPLFKVTDLPFSKQIYSILTVWSIRRVSNKLSCSPESQVEKFRARRVERKGEEEMRVVFALHGTQSQTQIWFLLLHMVPQALLVISMYRATSKPWTLSGCGLT